MMVRKARIFLGISFGGEVGRGVPGGVSGDGSLLFSIPRVVCWARTSLRGLSLLFRKKVEIRLKLLAMWKLKDPKSKIKGRSMIRTEDTNHLLSIYTLMIIIGCQPNQIKN